MYRLRVLEEDSFLKTVDSLGLGPIDFAELVRKHITVSYWDDQAKQPSGRFGKVRDERCCQRCATECWFRATVVSN